MGSYNIACSISKVSIGGGTDIVYIPLEIAKYPYKIGDGNNTLIYPWCFYSPVILPIFGKYDDYGGIEDIIRDKNVEYIENYFETDIQSIINIDTKVKPISSGMFVHRKIYDFMIHSDVDESEKSKKFRNKLYMKYYDFKKQLTDSQKRVKELNKFMGEKHKKIDIYSFAEDWDLFNFREYKTFQKIYRPCIVNGLFHNELVDFILFDMSMHSINSFYFPAMNGHQCGNYFASRNLYKMALKIVSKKIRDDKKSYGKFYWWKLRWKSKFKRMI